MALFFSSAEDGCPVQMQRSHAPVLWYVYVQEWLFGTSNKWLVLGKVNAAQLVVHTFPNLFNDAWLHGLLGQIGQDFVDESQRGLELAVREQLDYRQLLVCVEGYSRWRVLSSRNPKLLRCVLLDVDPNFKLIEVYGNRKGANVRVQEYQTWCFDMKVCPIRVDYSLNERAH